VGWRAKGDFTGMTRANEVARPPLAAEQEAQPSDASRNVDTTYRADAHAVIVGIDAYSDPQIRPLRYARADAEAVHSVLTNPEIGRINPANVTLLLNESATQRAIRSAIGTSLRTRASPDDTVVIYFAGHGAPEIDARGQQDDGLEKYLVPYDADLGDLFASAIAMDEVARLIKRISARQVVLFLDCCYGGTAGGRTFSRPDVQTRGIMSRRFLDQIASAGRYVITACDVNEVALETPEFGHGLFTHYLLKGLRGDADTAKTGVVVVDQLYPYLFAAVSSEARRRNGSMSPVMKGEARGPVVLAEYETADQRRAKALHPDAEKAYAQGRVDEAESLWQEVVRLHPGHSAATKRLDAIAADRAAVHNATQTRLARLREHYAAGNLSEEHFARGVEVAQMPESNLSGTDAKVRRLVDALVEGRLSVTSFSQSVALMTGTPGATIAPLPVVREPKRVELPRNRQTRMFISAGLLVTLMGAAGATMLRVPSAEIEADLRVEEVSFELDSAFAFARPGERLRAEQLDLAGLGRMDSVLVAPGRDPSTLTSGVRLTRVSSSAQIGIDLSRPFATGTRLTLRRTPAAQEYMLSFERAREPITLEVNGQIQLTSTGLPDAFRFASPTRAAVWPDSTGPLDLVAVLPREDTVVLARQVRVTRLDVRQHDAPVARDTPAGRRRSTILGGRVQVDAPNGAAHELQHEDVLDWMASGPTIIDQITVGGGDIRVRFRTRVDSLALGPSDAGRNVLPRVSDRIGGASVIVPAVLLVSIIVVLIWRGGVNKEGIA
jgi:uncharacterized caspase-like protein